MKKLSKIILNEEEESIDMPEFEETGEKTTLAEDSVDDQIDAYLLKFEKESMKSGESMLESSFLSMSLSGLIVEQDEDDEGIPPDAAPPENLSDTDADEADTDAEESDDAGAQEEEQLPPIDLVIFSKKVVRLVKNVQYLLDIERAVVARSLNYIKDNYDQDHVDTMIEILESRLGFAVDDETGDISAPFAVGAWAGGTGGLAGGGGV